MTEYTYRRSGTCGCEITDPNGLVIAWTVDAGWAGVIVGLLNHEPVQNQIDAGLQRGNSTTSNSPSGHRRHSADCEVKT